MAAKTWESDFRYAAIRESIKIVREHGADDLFASARSLCIPVANKPVVGLTPGKLFIVFLLLGFALLFGAAVVAGKAEGDQNRNVAWLIAGTGMGLSGMACFFVPVLADRFMMKRLLGARAGDLVRHDGELLCAEISHTDRSKMKIEIDGDDYVLLLADVTNQRLLVEGVAARYLIHAKDVTDFRPFEFMNYVGSELTFRISGDVSLSLAIARVSILVELTRQLPFLYFLNKFVKNRIHAVCARALDQGGEEN